MSSGFSSLLRRRQNLTRDNNFLLLWNSMNHFHSRIRNVVVLFAAAASGLILFLDDWQRDLSINHARWEESAKNPFLRPISLPNTPGEAVSRTKEWAKNHRLWNFASESTRNGTTTLKLTRRTRVFQFIDDITIEFHETASGVRVEAESRSRVGKGDLGQNPRNLIELSKALRSTRN